jgi:TonB family protein
MAVVKIGLLACVAGMIIAGSLLAEEPIKVTKDEALKAVTTKIDPEYSAVAKQLKLEGDVKIDVVINEAGAVEEVTSESGNPVLFNCVKEAVKRWKFSPFKSDGKPAKATTMLSFTFKVH